MKSLQKDLEDALRRARGDADHFKKQLTEAHRVAMSQASVAASVHAATSQVQPYFFIDWQNWLGDWENLEPMMQQLHSFLLSFCCEEKL